MLTSALVSVEEYLNTSYDPDCDYVDGRVVERNLGELDHSSLQTEISFYFRSRREKWGVHAFVEQRVQVSPTRFRIPDICVLTGAFPTEQIFRAPPFLAIEILSPDDEPGETLARVSDYLRSGTPAIWIVDPYKRKLFVADSGGIHESADLLAATELTGTVDFNELFRQLEEPAD